MLADAHSRRERRRAAKGAKGALFLRTGLDGAGACCLPACLALHSVRRRGLTLGVPARY